MLKLSKSELWSEVKRLGRNTGIAYQKATKAQLIALLTPAEKPAKTVAREQTDRNRHANVAIAGARRITRAELAQRDLESIQGLTESAAVHIGLAASAASAVGWSDLARRWRSLQAEFTEAFIQAREARKL
jgi:hypothetical protein